MNKVDRLFEKLSSPARLGSAQDLDLDLPSVNSLVSKESEIDHGSGGTIFKCRLNSDRNQIVVLKSFKRRPQESIRTYLFNSLNEFATLKAVQGHACVLDVYDFLSETGQDEPLYSMLIQYCRNGDLLSLLSKARKMNLQIPHQNKDFLFLKCAQAIKFLHSKNIVHRDIKPENFLIDERGELKLGDFGNAMDLNRIESYTVTAEFLSLGTTSFKSPELYLYKNIPDEQIDAKKINYKAIDIWALAILYFNIAILQKPWAEATSKDYEFKKYKSKYELASLKQLDSYQLNRNLDSTFLKLPEISRQTVVKMLNPDPDGRLTANEVLRSEWLIQVNISLEEYAKKSLSKGRDDEVLRIINI
ncbi:hypothetical protein KL920_002364 [Ogataea angusta]|nr:hypothetical protein KL920_002364 [Ogataea angusta]